MSETFEKKVSLIKKIFVPLTSPEQKYLALIELGRNLSPYPFDLKTPDRIVKGCQSTVYLHATLRDGNVFFEASADALISAGLAAILIAVYSAETPETILKRPPDFLAELGIPSSLSPSRAGGLAQIHLRMKQEALKFLLPQP